MLLTRALSAVVLLVPVLVLWWPGGIPWLVGVVVVAVLALGELRGALVGGGYRPYHLVGICLAVGLPVAAYVDPRLALVVAVASFVLMASLVLAFTGRNLQEALTNWALTQAGSLYVTLLIAHFVALRQQGQGLQWIAVAFMCTWVCDSAAYLVGKVWGRRPFAPRISPRKTWEGTVAGILAGALAGLSAMPLLGLHPLTAVAIGGGVAVAAILGDLAESFLKRQLGIKDFSSLIPGHGGILDRIDSLLFAVPVVYWVALLWSGF